MDNPRTLQLELPFVSRCLVCTCGRGANFVVFSGARNFELLTPEEQDFALNTTVQYAPRAYEWMADCKASADGLTIPNIGREKQLHELPPWTWDKVQAFPVSIIPAKAA